MALTINGGTEKAWWTIAPAQPLIGTVSFWMKSSQTTANVAPLTYWNNTSRNGWGVILNNPSTGKLQMAGYAASAQTLSLVSTSSTLNDGNPHHICIRYGRSTGNGCQMFIDGVQDASATNSGGWGQGSGGYFFQAGDQIDTFWPSYVGDIWDIAFWDQTSSSVLSDDEVKALAKGFSALLIRPKELIFYAPCIADAKDLKGNVLNAQTALGYAPHGKKLGQ